MDALFGLTKKAAQGVVKAAHSVTQSRSKDSTVSQEGPIVKPLPPVEERQISPSVQSAPVGQQRVPFSTVVGGVKSSITSLVNKAKDKTRSVKIGSSKGKLIEVDVVPICSSVSDIYEDMFGQIAPSLFAEDVAKWTRRSSNLTETGLRNLQSTMNYRTRTADLCSRCIGDVDIVAEDISTLTQHLKHALRMESDADNARGQRHMTVNNYQQHYVKRIQSHIQNEIETFDAINQVKTSSIKTTAMSGNDMLRMSEDQWNEATNKISDSGKVVSRNDGDVSKLISNVWRDFQSEVQLYSKMKTDKRAPSINSACDSVNDNTDNTNITNKECHDESDTIVSAAMNDIAMDTDSTSLSSDMKQSDGASLLPATVDDSHVNINSVYQSEAPARVENSSNETEAVIVSSKQNTSDSMAVLDDLPGIPRGKKNVNDDGWDW